MFKNYLPYTLALSFHRTCLGIQTLPAPVKERLMKSSEQMIHHFAASLHNRDIKDEAKNLFVSLICLRDSKEILDEAKAKGLEVDDRDLQTQFQVLHDRLEQLCLEAAKKENGQTRMLG